MKASDFCISAPFTVDVKLPLVHQSPLVNPVADVHTMRTVLPAPPPPDLRPPNGWPS